MICLHEYRVTSTDITAVNDWAKDIRNFNQSYYKGYPEVPADNKGPTPASILGNLGVTAITKDLDRETAARMIKMQRDYLAKNKVGMLKLVAEFDNVGKLKNISPENKPSKYLERKLAKIECDCEKLIAMLSK